MLCLHQLVGSSHRGKALKSIAFTTSRLAVCLQQGVPSIDIITIQIIRPVSVPSLFSLGHRHYQSSKDAKRFKICHAMPCQARSCSKAQDIRAITDHLHHLSVRHLHVRLFVQTSACTKGSAKATWRIHGAECTSPSSSPSTKLPCTIYVQK